MVTISFRFKLPSLLDEVSELAGLTDKGTFGICPLQYRCGGGGHRGPAYHLIKFNQIIMKLYQQI